LTGITEDSVAEPGSRAEKTALGAASSGARREACAAERRSGRSPGLQSLRKNAVVFRVNRQTGNSFERARLQPCRTSGEMNSALAAEGCFWSFPTFFASCLPVGQRRSNRSDLQPRMKLVHQGSWTGAAAPNACPSILAEKLPFDTRSGLFLLLYQGTTLVVPNAK
jgi:hypothetical protein